MSELIKKVTPHLQGKLDKSIVKERSQANRTLSYLEGWYVIDQANLIFGFENWTQEIIGIECVHSVQQKDDTRSGPVTRWHVSYVAKCRITVDGVVREDVGNGHGIDKDAGLAHESAVKEAMTDAMKRAFRTFGNKFGLALYDKAQANVASDKNQLIASDAVEFARHILGLIETGKLTDLGKETILTLARVNTIQEIPESFRMRLLDVLGNKKALGFVNEGKNPKDGTQVINPVIPAEEKTEELEKAVDDLMKTFDGAQVSEN